MHHHKKDRVITTVTHYYPKAVILENDQPDNPIMRSVSINMLVVPMSRFGSHNQSSVILI